MKSILINDLNIDCSVFLASIQTDPVGYSCPVTAQVSGELDPTEKVIIDFGSIKSLIKSFIDDRTSGPDHKMLVKESDVPLLGQHTFFDNSLMVIPDHVLDKLPDTEPLLHNYVDAALSIVSRRIEAHILEQSGKKVIINLMQEKTPDFYVPWNKSFVCTTFSYVHGLPNSTSWGCQNPVHGHYSVIAVKPNFLMSSADTASMFSWVPTQCWFVPKGMVSEVKDGQSTLYKVAYKTRDRGEASVTFCQKPIEIDGDTTIECLVEWAAGKMREWFKANGYGKAGSEDTFSIYVSEGIKKGCLMTSLKVED